MVRVQSWLSNTNHYNGSSKPWRSTWWLQSYLLQWYCAQCDVETSWILNLDLSWHPDIKETESGASQNQADSWLQPWNTYQLFQIQALAGVIIAEQLSLLLPASLCTFIDTSRIEVESIWYVWAINRQRPVLQSCADRSLQGRISADSHQHKRRYHSDHQPWSLRHYHFKLFRFPSLIFLFREHDELFSYLVEGYIGLRSDKSGKAWSQLL